jgi:hypothetical protein
MMQREVNLDIALRAFVMHDASLDHRNPIEPEYIVELFRAQIFDPGRQRGRCTLGARIRCWNSAATGWASSRPHRSSI